MRYYLSNEYGGAEFYCPDLFYEFQTLKRILRKRELDQITSFTEPQITFKQCDASSNIQKPEKVGNLLKKLWLDKIEAKLESLSRVIENTIITQKDTRQAFHNEEQ